MGCAQGALAKFAVEPGSSPHTFDTSSEPLEFLREDLKNRPNIIIPNGIRGTRSRATERFRLGPWKQSGSFSINPDPATLDLWLPRILGAVASGTTFAVAETLPSFGILVDRVTNTFEYKDCVVNEALLSGRANGAAETPEPLVLHVQPLWKGYAVGTSFPSLTLGTAANNAPYIFEDGVLTVDSVAYEFKSFQFRVGNALYARRINSLYPTALCPSDRVVQLQATLPYDVAGMVTNASAVKAATLVFTNGAMSLTLTFAGLQMMNDPPVVRGKTEVEVGLIGVAGSVTTTKEIVATNDSTA